MPAKLIHANKVVGVKQTLKALQKGQARVVYIAQDADRKLLEPIIEQCSKLGIPIVPVGTMTDLGRACLIDVGAAVASIIE